MKLLAMIWWELEIIEEKQADYINALIDIIHISISIGCN